MVPDIDARHDKVVIEKVEVKRPSRISPSQWLNFWERVNPDEAYFAGYAHGMNDASEKKR